MDTEWNNNQRKKVSMRTEQRERKAGEIEVKRESITTTFSRYTPKIHCHLLTITGQITKHAEGLHIHTFKIHMTNLCRKF